MFQLTTVSRLLAATLGPLWVAQRLLALALICLPATPPVEVSWVGVPLGGGTARVEAALRVAERFPGARLVLAGTAVEVAAAQRWLADARPPVEGYVVEPASSYACAVALRHAAGAEPGVLVSDGAHLPRMRLSWVLAGGLEPPSGIPSSAAEWSRHEVLKFFGYLLRH